MQQSRCRVGSSTCRFWFTYLMMRRLNRRCSSSQCSPSFMGCSFHVSISHPMRLIFHNYEEELLESQSAVFHVLPYKKSRPPGGFSCKTACDVHTSSSSAMLVRVQMTSIRLILQNVSNSSSELYVPVTTCGRTDHTPLLCDST
jgi:hypothetical protein